jgi:hypothetical protein
MDRSLVQIEPSPTRTACMCKPVPPEAGRRSGPSAFARRVPFPAPILATPVSKSVSAAARLIACSGIARNRLLRRPFV